MEKKLISSKEGKEKSVTWNFRADQKLKKETQVIVAARKGTDEEISMTQYVMESIKATNEGRDYKSLTQKVQVQGYQITQLEKENIELKLLNTKKIPIHKRISIGFTKDEYDVIVEAAHKAQSTSPSMFLKNQLLGDTILSQIIPKALE